MRRRAHGRRSALHAVDRPREAQHNEAPADPRQVHLSALGEAVGAIGNFRVRVIRSWRGPLVLRVTNPDLPHVAQDIACDMHDRDSGFAAWWFVWSDGTTISPADDPYGAAVAITRALSPRR